MVIKNSAECHSAECRSPESRGANETSFFFSLEICQLNRLSNSEVNDVRNGKV